MVLTNKTYFAVGSLILIAGKSGPLSLHEIAKVFRISVSYLEQIFNKLKAAGFVAGVRGPSGGYILARPAADIKLVAVLQALANGTGDILRDRQELTMRDQLLSKMKSEVRLVLEPLTLSDMMLDGDTPYAPPPAAATQVTENPLTGG